MACIGQSRREVICRFAWWLVPAHLEKPPSGVSARVDPRPPWGNFLDFFLEEPLRIFYFPLLPKQGAGQPTWVRYRTLASRELPLITEEADLGA